MALTHSKKCLFWIWLVPSLALQAFGLLPFRIRHRPRISKHHSPHTASTAARASNDAYPQNQKTVMEKGGGAIYRQSILTSEEFSSIQKELSLVTNQLNEETSSTVATNRKGASLSVESETVKILQEGSLCKFVQKVTGNPSMQLSFNLPVEVRLYEKAGSCMAWHEDDVLYDPPQVEAVITMENSSDCVTMWKQGEVLKSRETDPNSVLLLEAGGPLHCVTSLKRGRRLILKCAYRASNATFRQGVHKDQFGTSKIRNKKNATKRKRKK